MAHALALAGNVSLDINTNGMMLNHFVPQEAKKDANGNYQDVIETVEATILSNSSSDTLSKKRAFDQIFDQARRNQRSGVGQKVYLYYSVHGDSTLWRSEVLDGQTQLADDAMTAFVSNVVKLTLIIRRRYYWEDNTRRSISVSNSHGSGTGGVTIYPRDDSTHDNFVSIATSVITGGLPAPLEIRLKNNSGGGYDSRNFYISVAPYTTFAPDLQLEAEDSAGANVQPGSPDMTNYSGGKYVLFNSATTGTLRLQIPAATVQSFSGKRAKILLKMSSFSTAIGGLSNIYVRASLYDYYGVVTLYAGNEVLLRVSDDYFQDLGNLPIPLGDYATDWEALTLGLDFRTANGVAESFSVDYVSLFPVDEDSYRYIEQRGMELLNNSEIVDDGIEGNLYFYEGGKRHPILKGRGTPIYVLPTLAQRIYFLFDGYGSTLNWTYSVQLFYRPRKLTI